MTLFYYLQVKQLFHLRGHLKHKQLKLELNSILAFVTLVPRHQTFRVRPEALSKNRVWTPEAMVLPPF